jgi:fatty acid desaturase
MPSLMLVMAVVVLTVAWFVAVSAVVAVLLILFVNWCTMSPYEHAVRERRRHAERTARALRRMSEIRRRTIERMDRAEREV